MRKTARLKRRQNWAGTEEAIAELRSVSPLAADYWQLEMDDALFRLKAPAQSWKDYLDRATKEIDSVPGLDKNIPFRAFSNYFAALTKAGDLAGALAKIGDFADIYGKHCPLPSLSALAVLFIRAEQYDACLRFLDAQEEKMDDAQLRKDFRIRLHESRAVCHAKIRAAWSPEETVRELFGMMYQSFPPQTPQRQTLDNCLRCWSALDKAGGKRLHNIVNDQDELAQVQARIEDALRREAPFSLLRLGDGEAYGFLDLAQNTPGEKRKLEQHLETHWWETSPSPAIRKSMVDGFRRAVATADVLGFPGAYRLARDLANAHLKRHNPVVPNVLKLGTLFSGMEEFVRKGGLETAPWLTSEHCNHALSDRDFIAGLIARARAVVLVSGFDIPDGHVFRHAKVSRVHVPPARQQKHHSARLSHDTTLPEELGAATDSVRRLSGPGVLVFVCAGFAGKSLVYEAKKAGAVAIDYGSAIDMTLGRRTRAPELCARYATAQTQGGTASGKTGT